MIESALSVVRVISNRLLPVRGNKFCIEKINTCDKQQNTRGLNNRARRSLNDCNEKFDNSISNISRNDASDYAIQAKTNKGGVNAASCRKQKDKMSETPKHVCSKGLKWKLCFSKFNGSRQNK